MPGAEVEFGVNRRSVTTDGHGSFIVFFGEDEIGPEQHLFVRTSPEGYTATQTHINLDQQKIYSLTLTVKSIISREMIDRPDQNVHGG